MGKQFGFHVLGSCTNDRQYSCARNRHRVINLTLYQHFKAILSIWPDICIFMMNNEGFRPVIE